jgi:hypothetical protein
MHDVGKFIQWFFLGCLLVLVIVHAKDFATAVTAVGGEIRKDGVVLTGAQVNG